MNYFKFLYDVFIWITNNYSDMPEQFKNRFPEKDCINSRVFLHTVTEDLENINKDFKEYE